MKKPFSVRMEEEDIKELQKLGEPYGMEATQLGAVILSRWASLKREKALHALTAIPDEFFKPRAGRPATRTASADSDAA